MKMKKMLVGAFLGIFTFAGIALPNISMATGEDTIDDAGGRTNQNYGYNPTVAGSEKAQDDNLIHTIKIAINWVLGMLSFVALLLCLWGGFKMMTSGGDQKKYEEGLNILKWAAIGLAVIALSWLIVSLIFYLIGNTTKVDTKS